MSLIIALLAATPPLLSAMQASSVYIVDGSGQTTGTTHTSITGAAGVASSGDTILVVGLTSPDGYPVAYSDDAVVFPTQGNEAWPIPVQPGVTLKHYSGSPPVYLWSIHGGTDPLIEVIDSGNPDSSATVIDGIRLAAHSTGIRIHHSVNENSILVKNCWFAHLGDALDAKAAGVTTSVAVRNCQIRDDSLVHDPQANAPSVVTPSRGVYLQAEQGGSGPGVLLGEITELNTSGAFSTMNPVAWDIGDIDLR